MKLGSPYWRLLGVVAAVNEYMGRTQVNFVGGHVAVLLLLCTLGSLFPILIFNLPYILSNYRIDTQVIVFLTVVFLVGFISTVLACLFAISGLCRNIVFRAERDGESSPPLGSREDVSQGAEGFPGLRVSGELDLNDRQSARFVSVPASFTAGTSRLVFSAVIDTSTTYQAVWTVKRVGTWELAIHRMDIASEELGTLYYGTSARPALRLRHRRVRGEGQQHTVLSFDTEAERTRFLSHLST